MAGSTRTVKRQWSLTDRDALKAIYEELNNVIDDLETLRAEMVAETTSVLAASALVAAKTTTAESGD